MLQTPSAFNPWRVPCYAHVKVTMFINQVLVILQKEVLLMIESCCSVHRKLERMHNQSAPKSKRSVKYDHIQWRSARFLTRGG